MRDFYRALGQRIRRARKERRYTQTELGRLLGYSANAILGWEKGTRRVNIEDLLRLASVLEKPLSYFLEGREDARERGNAELLPEAFRMYTENLVRDAVARLEEDLIRAFREILLGRELQESIAAAVKDRVVLSRGKARGRDENRGRTTH
jgi:transcriptional regulator with XRE-family HTH domain